MELISKNHLCQVLGKNSTKDIKWNRIYLPYEVNQSFNISSIDPQKLLFDIEVPLLDDDLAFIYVPAVSLALLPEMYFGVTINQIIEKLKIPVELSRWKLEYLGNDNFPTFRHSEFMFGSDKVISDNYRDLENLQPGRYQLSSPGYNEVFELLIEKEDMSASWRWMNVNIASDIISSMKSRYSDRLFSSCVFQLCIFRDYK